MVDKQENKMEIAKEEQTVNLENKKKQYSILIIDDEEGVANSLKRLLIEAGFETKTAQSYEQARKILLEKLVDILLVDVFLPGPDGHETITYFQEEFSDWHPIIFFISGEPNMENTLKAMHLGASDFFGKPIAPNLILERIYSEIVRRKKSISFWEKNSNKVLHVDKNIINYFSKLTKKMEEKKNKDKRFNKNNKKDFITLTEEQQEILEMDKKILEIHKQIGKVRYGLLEIKKYSKNKDYILPNEIRSSLNSISHSVTNIFKIIINSSTAKRNPEIIKKKKIEKENN